jgi:hypothetical protein
MKARLALLLIPAAAAAAVLSVSSDGRAGESFGVSPPSCYSIPGGAGYCSGSAAGFKASSDPYAWLEFNEAFSPYTGNVGYFYAYTNGQYFTCTTTDPRLLAAWPTLVTGVAYFNIGWDTAAHCTGLSFSGGSY